MYKSLRGVIALALASCAISAMAAAPVVTSDTYSFGDLGYSNGKYASSGGEFVTDGAGNITSITGSFLDSSGTFGLIDGLVPLNSDGGFLYDNVYNGDFDLFGVLFDVGGNHVNLYKDTDGYHMYTYARGFDDINVDLWITRIGQTFAPEVQTPAVPEPASMAMMPAGLLGLGFLAKRKPIRA